MVFKSLLVLVTMLVASPSAHAAERIRPVNEEGDTRKCVTYREAMHVRLDMREGRAHRMLDTKGKRVTTRTIDSVTAQLMDLDQVAHGKHRVVRSYPTCAEDGVPAVFIVEYDKPGRFGVAMQTLWY